MTLPAHPADAAPAPLLTVASSPQAQSAAQPPQPPHQGLGQTLKRLREAQALSLAAVSARLKFSARQLNALETEDWASLPAGMPLRGLVKNYATLLQADPRLMLELLDASTSHARLPHHVLASGPGAAPGHAPARPLVEDASARSHWGWLIAIALLVGVALAYIVSRGGLADVWQRWQIGDWFK